MLLLKNNERFKILIFDFFKKLLSEKEQALKTVSENVEKVKAGNVKSLIELIEEANIEEKKLSVKSKEIHELEEIIINKYFSKHEEKNIREPKIYNYYDRRVDEFKYEIFKNYVVKYYPFNRDLEICPVKNYSERNFEEVQNLFFLKEEYSVYKSRHNTLLKEIQNLLKDREYPFIIDNYLFIKESPRFTIGSPDVVVLKNNEVVLRLPLNRGFY